MVVSSADLSKIKVMIINYLPGKLKNGGGEEKTKIIARRETECSFEPAS